MNTFGERLKYLRHRENLTQEQFADKLYLNKSSVSRYEKNQQYPEYDTLFKICTFFNISLDYLMCLTDIEKPLNNLPIEMSLVIENVLNHKEILHKSIPLSNLEKSIVKAIIHSSINAIENIRNEDI